MAQQDGLTIWILLFNILLRVKRKCLKVFSPPFFGSGLLKTLAWTLISKINKTGFSNSTKYIIACTHLADGSNVQKILKDSVPVLSEWLCTDKYKLPLQYATLLYSLNPMLLSCYVYEISGVQYLSCL
jgi:hypothetical protein